MTCTDMAARLLPRGCYPRHATCSLQDHCLRHCPAFCASQSHHNRTIISRDPAAARFTASGSGHTRGMTTTDHDTAASGYEAYYGLVESPFGLNPDPRFLFESRSHAAALELVLQAFRRRETLVIVTGEIGTGKTVLCRTVLQRLPRRTFLSVITNPLLDSTDLLKQVLEDFGILSKERDGLARASHHDLVRTLEQFLASLLQLQAHAVIMIDEAQHLRPVVLEQIRLLSNFESGGSKLLQIVLVGQPELSEVLARPDMRQLNQRISHRIELRPLEPTEIGPDIERRLWIAHGSPKDTTHNNSLVRFAPAALVSIMECSQGLPRVINLLCDRALENTYENKIPIVDARAILEAARHLEIPVRLGTRLRPYRRLSLAAAAALIVVGAGLWAALRTPGVGRAEPPIAANTTAGATGVAAPAGPDSVVPVGTLHEGESFTLRVAVFRTPNRAREVSGQVAGIGLPAFVRMVRADSYQVLAGPYASEEEAHDAQRRLDQARFTGSQMDSTPTSDIVVAASAAASSAVSRTFLLSASDRASIVVDLADDAARAVALPMTDDRSFGVEIGPFRQSVAAQDLEAPAASLLVGAVAVRGVAHPNDTAARVTVKTRTPVTGTVRQAKQRVYIDLAPLAAAAAVVESIPGAGGPPRRPNISELNSPFTPGLTLERRMGARGARAGTRAREAAGRQDDSTSPRRAAATAWQAPR